ncbi:diguanylate cyclase domain-containing protein [Sulfurovum sp.]|uniref:diguanylate cyclase domain-containing protein n=1 Tax=Sulfurovum sp. TaxID=1969726 RepID=UPI002867C645|nr:diguanylate cyclase [Sulfurovum sp.]
MRAQNIYYVEEKKHAVNRLVFLVILTFLSFVFFERTGNEVISNLFLSSVVLAVLVTVSLLHYALIVRYPHRLLVYRKSFLIILDIFVLTMLVSVYEQHGIYFLPFYAWIVMWSGSSFGIGYFYISIVAVAVAGISLLAYSPYWLSHYDILLAFSITTFLLPLFFLKDTVRIHEQNEKLTQELTTTEVDANTDTLTGIANRKVYKEEMKKALKSREFFALFFIDLNKFKIINDTHGHDVGDEVLREVTRRLSHNLGEEDFLARLGGDEFVIISKRKKVFLSKFVKKLEAGVIGQHKIDDIIVNISLSIGISMCPDDNKTEMLLSKYADEAMYAAKKKRGTYHVYYRDIAPVSPEEPDIY